MAQEYVRNKATPFHKMKLLFLLFGRAIHRYIAKGYLRPKGFTGMEVAFSGPDGRTYWSWQDIGEMTPVRQKHIERCLKMADAGIGEKALNELCDMGEVANTEAITAGSKDAKSKAFSRVAYIFREIRNRPTNVIPEEVYMDMAACFAVREDEDPRTFDPAIHGQKIEMLTKAMKDGHDFFGKLPALKMLLGSLLTTEAACIELLSAWAATRARMEALRKAYALPSTSK
jgi:hypothetical protein